MISTPFLRRQFFVTALIFASILTLATFLSRYLNHMEHSSFYVSQGSLLLNHINKQSGDKLEGLRALNNTNRDLGIPVETDVIRDGKSLLTGEAKDIPTTDQRVFVHDIDLPEPAKFVATFSAPRNTFFNHGLLTTFAVMFGAILLASALSMLLLFWNFRDKAALAKSVLLRMQKGDLKARFPTSRLDEVGKIMVLFNQMAFEIERLVEQLKLNETQRLQLLQELTHDLRTPVSSLRNLLETLRFDQATLAAKDKEELMELAFQETEYLTRLVEDLLFLALVLEPKYKTESEDVFVQELLLSQVSAVSATKPEIKTELIHCLDGQHKMTGNPHLIKRLFRNALDNAFSFARSKVEIDVSEHAGKMTILIRDDGQGLNQEALENFGKKRSTRYQGAQRDGRLSVGLGSVILQAIANAHGGSVAIRNVSDERGGVRGAELNITIRTNENLVSQN